MAKVYPSSVLVWWLSGWYRLPRRKADELDDTCWLPSRAFALGLGVASGRLRWVRSLAQWGYWWVGLGWVGWGLGVEWDRVEGRVGVELGWCAAPFGLLGALDRSCETRYL